MNDAARFCQKCGTQSNIIVANAYTQANTPANPPRYAGLNGQNTTGYATIPGPETYEKEERPAGNRVISGINKGVSVGVRIWGAIIVVGGIVLAISARSPVPLLASAYGVYLVLGGRWIIF